MTTPTRATLEEMEAENVRLGCRCWDPPRDPQDIGHLESCPALAHRQRVHFEDQARIKAERDEAVALLREIVDDLNDKNELYPGGSIHLKARALLARLDGGAQ